MKKYSCLLLFVLLFVSNASYAQDASAKCQLTLSDAPALHRNLRLGMTIDEVSLAIPVAFQADDLKPLKTDDLNDIIGSSDTSRPVDVGEKYFAFNDQSLPGQVLLYFFDNKVHRIELYYDNSGGERDLKYFASLLSGYLNFPVSQTDPAPRPQTIYFTNCQGFNIQLGLSANKTLKASQTGSSKTYQDARLTLSDTETEKYIQERIERRHRNSAKSNHR